jgi:lysine/ornithine N-monooxygenase
VEVRTPSTHTHVGSLPPELRGSTATDAPSAPEATSKLIERLYELQYTQRVKTPNPLDWRFQIIFSSKVTNLKRQDGERTVITYLDRTSNETHIHPRTFDLIVAATGISQHEQERLLQPLRALLEEGRVSVDANYRINLRKRAVTNGRGVWLIGSLGGGRFVSDPSNYPLPRL